MRGAWNGWWSIVSRTGRSFQDGFRSARFTQLAAPVIGSVPGDAVGRTAAAAVVGGTASRLGGGKFANGAQTFGFLRLFQELPGYYEKQVGFDLDASPGGNAAQKTEFSSPVEGANNIGFQGGPVDNPCFGCEGGSLSLAADQIPGINAVAGLHDVFQTSMGTSIWRDVLNVPGMPVAAEVTYGGFIGQALNTAPANLYVPINVRRDGNRKSRNTQVYFGGF